jgi:hypothetical protein
MTIDIASQEFNSFEISLLNRRFRHGQTMSLDAASIDAAILSASAILQLQLAGQVDLVGFELRCNGVRVRTCLESLRTVAVTLAAGADERPRGPRAVFSLSFDTPMGQRPTESWSVSKYAAEAARAISHRPRAENGEVARQSGRGETRHEPDSQF